MSLDIARLIAFSAISATEAQISVASSNISNADTAGYTQKTANQVADVTNGVGTGVSITGISSNVDKLLLKSLIGANSDLGSANTTNDYITQLQQLFGTASSAGTSTTGTSLANSLASLQSALSQLESTPSSASLQSGVVNALNNVASQLRDTSSGIQSLRSNADQDIATSVGSVNTDLTQIASLNSEIKQAAAAGQSTADLEDQRNSALEDLSSYMNISYSTTPGGDLQIYTSGGQALVNSSGAHTLSHTAASNVTASASYSSGGFSGITVNGTDITSQITSGSMGALVTLRDQTLPGEQSQLDQLANQLKSALNSATAGASSVPPPTTLTGSNSVDSAASWSATGTVRIASTDQAGNLVSYTDYDLSTYSSLDAFVSAVNSNSSSTGVTASDANGQLSLTSTKSGDGVAVGNMTSSIGGQSFSSYLGMNDLVTGTGASSFAVNSGVLNGTGGFPIASLVSSATPGIGSKVLDGSSTAIVDALSTALTGSTSFAAAGGLSATTTSFADYASDIIANVASKASQASSTYTAKSAAQENFANTMASESGVNVDEETAKVSSLQNKYAAASQLLSAINAMFSSLITAMQTA